MLSVDRKRASIKTFVSSTKTSIFLDGGSEIEVILNDKKKNELIRFSRILYRKNEKKYK